MAVHEEDARMDVTSSEAESSSGDSDVYRPSSSNVSRCRLCWQDVQPERLRRHQMENTLCLTWQRHGAGHPWEAAAVWAEGQTLMRRLTQVVPGLVRKAVKHAFKKNKDKKKKKKHRKASTSPSPVRPPPKDGKDPTSDSEEPPFPKLRRVGTGAVFVSCR